MKILLLGSNGQVGSALHAISKAEGFPIGWELIAWTRGEGDLSNPAELIEKIKSEKPDVIINAAAYTQVDKAETEPKICQIVNVKAPEAISKYCTEQKIPMVHFSSDYVYAGEGSTPHSENDSYYPMNYYGMTKARGDQAVQKAGCDYLIFRTSWVYSHVGRNFVLTMKRLAKEQEVLKVVNDQIGSPTYAPDLARYSFEALMMALEKKLEGKPFPSGIYHVSNRDTTNWCEFARAILPDADIQGIPSTEYPTPAKRPLNSRLDLTKFVETFGIQPRPWREALDECLKKVGKSNG